MSLIDKAISKNLTLNTVCPSNNSLTNELQIWQEGLLKTLGLVNILGQLKHPMQQLYKMRDSIAQEKDGIIIYKP
ncbi:hypothetical protein NDK43_18020 [Neobacillus pocheonensis]|uniref:Uncharacterized protein n=1 Tax=Neobacillus pocheonensis TaxID=363869 RepID=A0ABT0WC65_9BACI|nr:hypothetical protein [Neobacillus pocheonensis]